MKKITTVFLFLIVPAAVNFCYSQLWKQYADSVKFFIGKKMPDKAFENYGKAKEVMPADSTFIDTLAPSLRDLAGLYYNIKQANQAIVVCQELMTRVSKVHSEVNAYYAWGCNLMGVIYNQAGKLDTAKIFYLKAKEIREKVPGNRRAAYAQSCNNLGALYRDLGEYENAEPLLLEAKEIREKLDPQQQQDPYAITCISLANLYRDIGQYQKAEQFYLLAKERRSASGKDNEEYASACNILADLYAYMGQFQKAQPLYIEAKDIREKLDSGSYEYGQSCNNLASLYKEQVKDLDEYKQH